MFRLPVELRVAVFSYLNFYQLLRAQQVCRQWQQTILDSHLWPSSISMWPRNANCDQWEISWPDWTDKEKEQFECNPHTTCQVLQTLSKGSTKSLLVNYYTRITHEDILEVLPNFLFLEKLWLQMASISSRELISILQSLPQISTFILFINEFQGTIIGHLTTLQLNLRRLSIHGRSRGSTLQTTVANIVQHSPELVSLTVNESPAKQKLTMKLGDGIKCLAINVKGNLPPISARGLKCLKFMVDRGHGRESFEHCGCDLSYLTHLELYGSSSGVDSDEAATGEVELSIMEAYNIGENLEILRLESEPNHKVFIRTPKLKELRMIDLFPVSPDVCPMLQTVRYPDYWDVNENDWKERKLDLESRGIEIRRVCDQKSTSVYDMAICFACDMSVCYACGENHT
jgi:hypothetical protein